MNTTINPGGQTRPQGPTLGSRPSSGNSSTESSSRTGASTVQSNDRVQLTESALVLTAAANAFDAPVDSPRVEQLRQSILDGSYQVDPQKVADRMLQLERQLG